MRKTPPTSRRRPLRGARYGIGRITGLILVAALLVAGCITPGDPRSSRIEPSAARTALVNPPG
ncbi:MAG: hypothetical protein ACJ77C_04620 [Chloroflexota bacterium]